MTKLLLTLLIIISFSPLCVNANANSNTFIRIDKIKLNVKVASTTGTLAENALAMDKLPINQGSEICGNGNAYISGHSSPTKKNQKAGKVFANLHKLNRGDIINSDTCSYQIRSITKLSGKANKNGISYIFPEEEKRFVRENTFENGTLTLQTCTKKQGEIIIIKAIKL